MSARESGALLTILGAGTLMPDAERTSAAHHLRSDGASILLDCGAGTVHGFARHRVEWRDLTHVAISHWHNDHVGDLPALLFALKHGLGPARSEPLTLVGPRGLHGLLERCAAAFGDHVIDPGFEVRIVELDPPGVLEDAPGGFRLECRATPHTPESVAWRLSGTWGALGYTGDTGPSEEVAAFLAGCDALIAECTLPDEMAVDTHLSPSSLAALAVRARPELLLVAHVTPYHTPSDAVRSICERYDGRVVAAVDGLRVALGPGGPAVDPPGGRL